MQIHFILIGIYAGALIAVIVIWVSTKGRR
jgi:hypothetical protein